MFPHAVHAKTIEIKCTIESMLKLNGVRVISGHGKCHSVRVAHWLIISMAPTGAVLRELSWSAGALIYFKGISFRG